MSRKFRKYYEMKTVATDKGDRQVPVYKGAYYRFKVTDKERLRVGMLFLALSLLNMGFFISCGMLNGVFSRIIFITVPYAVQFLPAMFLLAASFNFLVSRGDMTVPDYISRFRKIKTMSITNLFLSLATAAESILVLIFRKIDPGPNEMLFIVFMVFIAIILGITLFLHKKMEKSAEIINDNQNKVPDEKP